MIKRSSINVDVTYKTTAAAIRRAVQVIPPNATVVLIKNKDESYIKFEWTEIISD